MRICLLRAACFVIYSSYSLMILFSSEIFVVLLLWLRHLLVTLLTAIVFKFLCTIDLTNSFSNHTPVSANFVLLAVFHPNSVWGCYFLIVLFLSLKKWMVPKNVIAPSKEVGGVWFVKACHVRLWSIGSVNPLFVLNTSHAYIVHW